MISSQDLNRCIDILSELNEEANTSQKRLLLELGYIIKQELDLVAALERKGQTNTKNGKLELKGLLDDNVQLFNENRKLLEDNIKLRQIIDSTAPLIDQKIGLIQSQLSAITNKI